MRNFKIGDEAIALNSANGDRKQPRKKGRSYTVTDVLFCSSTGMQMINIDKTPGQGRTGKLKCICGNHHDARGRAWTLSENFVHPQNIDGLIASAIEKENYELAVELRDLRKADVLEES